MAQEKRDFGAVMEENRSKMFISRLSKMMDRVDVLYRAGIDMERIGDVIRLIDSLKEKVAEGMAEEQRKTPEATRPQRIHALNVATERKFEERFDEMVKTDIPRMAESDLVGAIDMLDHYLTTLADSFGHKKVRDL